MLVRIQQFPSWEFGEMVHAEHCKCFIKFNKAVDKKMEEGYTEDEAIKIVSESWNPPIDEVIK